MVTCWHCKQECSESHHARVVDNCTALHGPWSGWRMAGRDIVSPQGQRVSVERMRGLLWRDELDLRLAGYTSRRKAERDKRSYAAGPQIKVVVIDLAEYRENGYSVA